MSHWIILPLLLPLAAGILNLLLVKSGPGPQRLVSLIAVAGLLPVAVLLLRLADSGAPIVYQLGNWPAPFGIALVVDRLSALLLLLTAIMSWPVLLYATGGDDRRGHNFHVLFPLQVFGINGAFLAGDLFNLFVFFEILLIASYSLAVHGGGPGRIRAGLHYVVLNLLGSSLFLVAIGTLYAMTGTLNMADLAVEVATAAPEQVTLLRISALLLLVVFALKAAVLPLHLWLPTLYSSITAPVAALFAIMTKVGVYAILRTFTLIFPLNSAPSDVAGWLPPLALLTMAAGTLGLLSSRRLTALIAYLVVVSVGTLLAGIGLFTVAGITAVLYYLPHTTLITAGMFLLADLIAWQRGAAADWFSPGPPMAPQVLPLLGVLFFVGAVASAGIPPLSGFIGKLLLLQAVPPEETVLLIWLWSIVLLGGLAALISLSRAGSLLFWTTEGEMVTTRGQGLRLRLVVPVVLLLTMSVVMTLFAAPICRYAEATATQLLTPGNYITAVLREEKQ
ncbi:monovalent cation/H+ antiporter subunit D [Desulfocastanea catecholica]